MSPPWLALGQAIDGRSVLLADPATRRRRGRAPQGSWSGLPRGRGSASTLLPGGHGPSATVINDLNRHRPLSEQLQLRRLAHQRWRALSMALCAETNHALAAVSSAMGQRQHSQMLRARRTECPRRPVSISTLNTIPPGQLAPPCSPSPPRGAPQVERLGEEPRAVGTAANFSRGAWC